MGFCVATTLIATGLCACGCLSQAPSSSAHSPSADARTSAYVALVQGVYARYNTASGDGYNACVVNVDPPRCHDRGVAMAGVWQQFLGDLGRTPAPPQFVADDTTIRNQLPKGIADLKAMVEAAAMNDKSGVLYNAQAYIADMQPSVTDALGDVYAPWRTN